MNKQWSGEFVCGKKYTVTYEDRDKNIVKKHNLKFVGEIFPTCGDECLQFNDDGRPLYIDPYSLMDVVELDSDESDNEKKIQLLVDDGDVPYRWKPNFREIIGADDYHPFCMLRIDEILYPAIYIRYDEESDAYVFEYVRGGFAYMYGVTKDKLWNQDCYIINFKSGKEVHRTSLIERGKQWNLDVLKIGNPYRLVKDGKTTFALLSQINETCLVFVTAEREASNSDDPKYPDNCYVEILVRPGFEYADYDVYRME